MEVLISGSFRKDEQKKNGKSSEKLIEPPSLPSPTREGIHSPVGIRASSRYITSLPLELLRNIIFHALSTYLLSKEGIFVSMQLSKSLLGLKEAFNNHRVHYNRAPLFPRMSHDRKRESEESKFNYGGGGREGKRMRKREREGEEESNACLPTTCFIPPGPCNAQFHLGGLSMEDVVWMIGDILLFAGRHTTCVTGRVN